MVRIREEVKERGCLNYEQLERDRFLFIYLFVSYLSKHVSLSKRDTSYFELVENGKRPRWVETGKERYDALSCFKGG